MCENQKQKRKYGNKRNFYIKLHLTDHLDIEFTACQIEPTPEEALTSFTTFDALLACGSGIVIEVRK